MRSIIDKEEAYSKWLANLPDGIPCDHPGCLMHITHPCENCGRIAGRRDVNMDTTATKKDTGISKFWPETDAIIEDTRKAVKRFIYPLNAETLIHRPPGQCITIENSQHIGDHAELWMDLSYLDEFDLEYLRRRLIKTFTKFWGEYTIKVTFPGEEQ